MTVDQVRRRLRTTLTGAVAELAKRPLARISLLSFLLKGLSMVLLFAYGLLLARLLGAEQYGIYEYAFAWLSLLLVPAVFGLDKIALRTFAASGGRGDWSEARGLLRWSTRSVGAGSLVLAVATGYVAWAGAGREVTPTVLAIWVVCATLPVSALTLLWEGGLRGLHRVIEGQLPILIVRPLLAIVLLASAILGLGWPASAVVGLGTYLAAGFVAMLVAGIRLYGRRPAEMREASASIRPKAWLVSAIPLAVMAALYIANGRLGIILLGAMVGPEEAGIFALIGRGADLILFAMLAVNTALSPTFARLYASGDIERLQRVVTRGTLLMFALAFPVAACLFVFGDLFLLLFGESFVVGLRAMRILILGQCLNIAMGSVGVLLTMTNREQLAMLGFGSGAVVNVGLAFLLIPRYGVEGAAIAATASIVIWNIVLGVSTYRAIGIDSTILAPVVRWVSERRRT